MATIQHSVGLHGVNRPTDVEIVQTLLNGVPTADGGPSEKLKIDGLCGRKTNSAIEHFQAHAWGWRKVTTRVEPDGATLTLLRNYERDHAPPVIPLVAPMVLEPAKIVGTEFLITMAAKPGQQLDVYGSNFWFLITDYKNQSSRALYYFGSVEAPMPEPLVWSITRPPIVKTPKAISAADWAGTAIFQEKDLGRTLETTMALVPDALESKFVTFEIHAHLNVPQGGGSRSHISNVFRLMDANPSV